MRYITNRFDKGIVRNIAGNIAITGACEELINLRLKGGQLKVIGNKKTIMQGVTYDSVLLHKGASYSNTISIEGSSVKLVVDSVETLIYSGSGTVSVSFINNLLIINDTGAESLVVYQFVDGVYSLFFDKYPDLPAINIYKTYAAGTGSSSYLALPKTDMFNNSTKIEAKTTLIGLYNEILRTNDYNSRGWMLVCLNFTLFDGSETKMSHPVFVNLTESTISAISDADADIFSYANVSGYGTVAHAFIQVYSVFYKMQDIPDYSSYKDLIRSVNVYATNPISDIDTSNIDNVKLAYKDDRTDYKSPFYIKKTKYDKRLFDNLLFYKQKSIDLAELNTTEEFQIRFGDYLSTGKTMPVDSSGWINTTGVPFVYNNRLHLYDIKRTISKSQLIFDEMSWKGENALTADAYVYIKTGEGDRVVKGVVGLRVAYNSGSNMFAILNDYIAYPDSRAYKIIIIYTNEVLQQTFVGTLQLIASRTYNFAFTTRIPASEGNCALNEASINIEENLSYNENNVIIASEQNNPAYYNVDNSYRVSGNIQDLAVMAEQISETQTGQFPVFIFTDAGIYALEQGSGQVLYSNIIPINSDRCNRGVKQTKSGIAYIANNKVYILSGRIATDISAVLEGNIDETIRSNESFDKAINNAQLCVSSAYLSAVNFQEYITGAIILYNAVENEIIVSNTLYSYSYVFSINTGSWSKITEVFASDSTNYALSYSSATSIEVPASHARAILTLQNLICSDEIVFTSQAKALFSNCNAIIQPCSANLKLNNEIIASITLQYPTSLYILFELLLRNNSNYAVEFSSATNIVTVYTDSTTDVLKTLALETSAGLTIADDFEANSASVTIARKGINETIAVTLNGVTEDYVISSVMTISELIAALLPILQSISEDFTVFVVNNSLRIEYSLTGPAGNLNNLTVTSSKYCIFSVSNFQGGADASTQLIAAGKNVVDITQEEDNSRLIHVQTRPFSLESSGFKNIKSALRGIIFPADDKIIGCYLFASNDLINWDIIEAGQLNRVFSLMKLRRSRSSFRYFIALIAGVVETNTELTHIDIEIQDRENTKLR